MPAIPVNAAGTLTGASVSIWVSVFVRFGGFVLRWLVVSRGVELMFSHTNTHISELHSHYTLPTTGILEGSASVALWFVALNPTHMSLVYSCQVCLTLFLSHLISSHATSTGILEAILSRVLEALGSQVAACLVGAKAGGMALR